MRYKATSDWLGLKLGIDPDKIMLLIGTDEGFKEWVGRTREEKMRFADSVEFTHSTDPSLKRIIIGPNNVRVGENAERIALTIGYKSQEYRDFAEMHKDKA